MLADFRLLLRAAFVGLYRTLDDRERIGWVLYLLAQVLFASKGDLERTRVLTEQSLVLFREIGFKPAMPTRPFRN